MILNHLRRGGDPCGTIIVQSGASFPKKGIEKVAPVGCTISFTKQGAFIKNEAGEVRSLTLTPSLAAKPHVPPLRRERHPNRDMTL